MPAGRKLKVYWAEIDGLNDWVVAAPNRAEALKAFGLRQDLFAQGEAGDIADGEAVGAARAAPLTPLRRPKGSSQPFVPATGFTDWSAAIPDAKHVPGGSKAKAKPPPKPKADRRPLDRAEARLAEIEARHREALQRMAEDRVRLDERQAREDTDYAEAVARAKDELRAAERAFSKAGGKVDAGQ